VLLQLRTLVAGIHVFERLENLYAADLAFLQDFYNCINRNGQPKVSAVCPKCAHEFGVEVSAPGGS